MFQQIEEVLGQLKKTKPLILNLTNFVTMDFMANALLSLGASPIMTVCNEELEDVIKISHAININIGTLDSAFIKRGELAIEIAAIYQKPVILDPVGAGASVIRTAAAKSFLSKACIVRGNASEIIALDNKPSNPSGVESVHLPSEAKKSALNIAKKYGCTVIVSGATDYVTDGKKERKVPYGSCLMQYVTGMGCVLTAVVASFEAVLHNAYESAVMGTVYVGLCGQFAARETQSPGTFRSVFIDALHGKNLKQLNTLLENVEKSHEI